MRPNICVLETGANPNLLGASFLDTSLLNGILQWNILYIFSSSDTNLKLSAPIALYIRIGEPGTIVYFGVVSKLTVSTDDSYQFINQIETLDGKENLLS